jgi:hypothetical protein
VRKEGPYLERWAVELLPPHPADAYAYPPLERALPTVEEAIHLLPHGLRRRSLPEQPPVQSLLHVLLGGPPRYVLHPRRHLRLHLLPLLVGASGFGGGAWRSSPPPRTTHSRRVTGLVGLCWATWALVNGKKASIGPGTKPEIEKELRRKGERERGGVAGGRSRRR